jgi:hypothetical protein
VFIVHPFLVICETSVISSLDPMECLLFKRCVDTSIFITIFEIPITHLSSLVVSRVLISGNLSVISSKSIIS